jgi:hypothetical protein
MGADRRIRKIKRTPERRYADRRQAHTFRAVVNELLERGEIEIVETIWGREFRRLPAPNQIRDPE